MATVNPSVAADGRHNDILTRSALVHVFGNAYTPTLYTFSGSAGTYVSGDATSNVIDIDNYRQVLVSANVNIGSGTDVRVRFDWSHDGSTWFQEDSEDSATSGQVKRVRVVHVFENTGSHQFPMPKIARYLKIFATYTGTSSTSTLALSLVGAIV